MHIARLQRDGQAPSICRVVGDVAVPLTEAPNIGSDPLKSLIAFHATGGELTDSTSAESFTVADAVHLAPLCEPSKIICVGLNYVDHAKESGFEAPRNPVIFAKFPNTLIGHRQPIVWHHDDSAEVDYEAELGVVIGRRCQRVDSREALRHVFGYMACNDISARDAQFSDGQWVRGKSFDGFLPVGPIITADEVEDPRALEIRCVLNGVTLQQAPTSDMIFGVAEIISYLSRFMTLEPGDVIATGTPPGVGFARTPPVFLRDGDVVDVSISGFPTLSNPVRVLTP